MRRFVGGILGLCSVLHAPAELIGQATAAGPVSVRLGGLAQFQFNTTSLEAPPSSTFEVRRAFVGVSVGIAEWIEGRIVSDFGLGQPRLVEASMNLGFSERFQLRLTRGARATRGGS